jgi:DNA-binding HxlR family transcriptional regulator
MSESFDREKVIDSMFDPITSEILAELEDGKKECSVLSQKFSMSESDLLERLAYLIECEFLIKTIENEKYSISANTEKLSSLLEDDNAFDGAIYGLEKMDSYLN